MTFSLFDLWHFVTSSYDSLLDDLRPSAPVTRKPLGWLEKRRLEKEFIDECPEYAQVGKLKHKTQTMATVGGALAGALAGGYAQKRTFQPLSGLVFGALSFIVARMYCAKVFPAFTQNSQHHREFDRAFSLWLMYTKERPMPTNLPITSASAELEKDIKKFASWKASKQQESV